MRTVLQEPTLPLTPTSAQAVTPNAFPAQLTRPTAPHALSQVLTLPTSTTQTALPAAQLELIHRLIQTFV